MKSWLLSIWVARVMKLKPHFHDIWDTIEFQSLLHKYFINTLQWSYFRKLYRERSFEAWLTYLKTWNFFIERATFLRSMHVFRARIQSLSSDEKLSIYDSYKSIKASWWYKNVKNWVPLNNECRCIVFHWFGRLFDPAVCTKNSNENVSAWKIRCDH